MKNTIKKVIKKDNTVKKLNDILLDYFVEESIYMIDENMIICPIGTFAKEEGGWGFDLDFAYMTENQDNVMLMYLIKEVTKKGIDLIFFMGHYTIFNDDNICCGCVFEQDIDEYMEENEDCFYEDALEELSNKLITDYAKEIKAKGNLQ